MTLFILFVVIIALLFLFINLVFAPHNPYQEKDSMFECGFHSFQQSRSPFNIAFFIYALVYLLLDLEILLTFPFAVSEYVNNIYGLIITLGFISIITIGFVYELGKGALKIPSRQQTYTVKNQPLIHISYIETKSAKITKSNSFRTSPTLQSSIFPFTINIKNGRKYLTLNNIIIGLVSLIVMGLVKTLHIPTYILNLFNLENIEFLEYIIAGFFGLVSRLGFKGIVEAIFVDNYATMGGEDPTQVSSSPLGSKTGSAGTTGTSSKDLSENDRQTGSSGPSDDNRQLESESSPESTQKQKEGGSSSEVDTQTQDIGQNLSTNSSRPRYAYGARQMQKSLDGTATRLIEEIKNLTISMEKTEDDDEWKRLKQMKDSNLDDLQMLTAASAEEVKKLVSIESDSTTSAVAKRDIDAVEVDKKEEGEPSKKK